PLVGVEPLYGGGPVRRVSARRLLHVHAAALSAGGAAPRRVGTRRRGAAVTSSSAGPSRSPSIAVRVTDVASEGAISLAVAAACALLLPADAAGRPAASRRDDGENASRSRSDRDRGRRAHEHGGRCELPSGLHLGEGDVYPRRGDGAEVVSDRITTRARTSRGGAGLPRNLPPRAAGVRRRSSRLRSRLQRTAGGGVVRGRLLGRGTGVRRGRRRRRPVLRRGLFQRAGSAPVSRRLSVGRTTRTRRLQSEPRVLSAGLRDAPAARHLSGELRRRC